NSQHDDATASCAGGIPYTDASGVATCNVILGGKAGTGNLSVNVGNYIKYNQVPFEIVVGSAAIIKLVNGDNQSGKPGQTLGTAIQAQVTDLSGNPISGVAVVFEPVTPGGASFTNVQDTSDSAGYVSANVI